MTSSDINKPLEERHYTIAELAKMWNFSTEFVRQIVTGRTRRYRMGTPGCGPPTL